MHFYPTYWHRLFAHWQKDLKAFIYLACLLSLSRITLLAFFYKELEAGVDASSFCLCFYRGFQFDARVITSLLAPTFILGLGTLRFWSESFDRVLNRIRLCLASAFIVLTILVSIINTGFFSEYHEQFNHWIFGLFFDDRLAIWKTICKTYPLFKLLALSGFLSFVLIVGLKRYLQRPFCDTYAYHPSVINKYVQSLLLLIFITLFVGGLRGSFGNRPLQNIDIAITKDSLLNRIIPNAYFALVYAIYDHQTAQSQQGLESFWPSNNIREALQVLRPISAKTDSLLDFIAHTAPGPISEKPEHIFIIVMESQDTWPLLERYQSLNLNPCLKSIAEEGFWVKASVSGASGTLPSLSTFITGCPFVNVFPNFHPKGTHPYPTAPAPLFKALGYTANFFYGGYLSWQRIEYFCKNQGFDHSYGGSLMGPWENNEWGVHDKQLFEFILQHLDPAKPSVNLIMTTSNHAPYNVNLAAEGCSLPVPQADLPWEQPVEPRLLKILAHTSYSDKCLGEFIHQAKDRFPRAVFVITGDHWSRRFIHKKPSLYESRSVPIIFYAPSLMDFKDRVAPHSVSAAHIDIIKTLVDLCAPEGFQYPAFGKNIFDTKTRIASFGAGVVITPSHIFWPNPKSPGLETLPHALKDGLDSSPQASDIQALSTYHRALQAAGWWLTTQGPELPKEE